MFKRFLQPEFLKRACASYKYTSKRLAGHSKWANIKHTKELKDNQRGRMFTKLSQQIKVAVQEGGSINPALNLKLEQIITQAKRMRMPVATIENVIKSTQKDKTQMKSHTFEIKGPGGCIILCEVFSANVVKTRNDISAIMKKHACKYSDGGGRHLFEHKGIIETELPSIQGEKSNEAVLELATNHAIESEAEDVQLEEDSNKLQFLCDARNFSQVQKSLEKLNYKISSASLEYIPNLRVPLNDSDLELCSGFFDKLDNMEDVVKLYDNIG